METSNNYIICFGEVLWDIFPTGSKAGGAPFNVAYNLFRMGIDTKMLSKVGDDELGNNLLEQIKSWGMTTDYIQIDTEKPTGTVLASFDEDGEAIYDIVQDVAWDDIQFLPLHAQLVNHASAFVFGSLSTRSEVSKKTLLRLLDLAKFKVFDVNLRPPFVDVDFIQELLCKADLVKLNKAELGVILGFLGEEYVDDDSSVRHVQTHYDIHEVVLTKGSKGASYFVGDKSYTFSAVPVDIADTVGSGDSFLAGFLSQRTQYATPEKIMQQAIALGAFITSKHGACPDYTYDEFEAFRERNNL